MNKEHDVTINNTAYSINNPNEAQIPHKDHI